MARPHPKVRPDEPSDAPQKTPGESGSSILAEPVAEGALPDPRFLSGIGRLQVGANVLDALCLELDIASQGIEDGMIDVSTQFRNLADRALSQSEELRALAQAQAPDGASESALPQSMLADCVAGMIDTVEIVTEQSVFMSTVFRDMYAQAGSSGDAEGESRAQRWSAVANEMTLLSDIISYLGDLIAGTLSDLKPGSTPGEGSLGTVDLAGLHQRLRAIRTQLTQRHHRLSKALDRSVEMSRHVERSLPQVTKAIQFQDTAKQRMDNVRAAIALVARDLSEAAEAAPLPGASRTALESASQDVARRVVDTVTLGEMRLRLASTLLGETEDAAPAPTDEVELF